MGRTPHKVDAWQEPIVEWLRNRSDVSVPEVLEHALGFPREQWTQRAQNRVVNVLTNLGFRQHRSRTPQGRQRRYFRDHIATKDFPRHPDHADQPERVGKAKPRKAEDDPQ